MKRIIKRSLSIFLALVLIATTFFIFDPSVLKLDSQAKIDVVDTTVDGIPSVTFDVPETIYLKPGASTFQYFLNNNLESKSAIQGYSTSGRFYFSCSLATKIVVSVKYYTRSGTTITQKTSGSSLTGTNPTGTYNSTSVNQSLEGGSLSGVSAGSTVFIEWQVVYTVSGVDYTIYAYTGVYAPYLGTSGSIFNRMYDGDLSDPESRGYFFLTGIHSMSGGDKLSKFTGTTAGQVGAAPLVDFSDSTSFGA